MEATPSSDPQIWATLVERVRPVLVQMSELLARSAGRKARHGYERGIDFYSAASLPAIVANDSNQFRQAQGRYPELLRPRLLSDKIFVSKYFRPMKVPETGNKLLTSSFIPDGARDLVGCPEIVWHSPEPRVPRGSEVDPGAYYLKTSHGANMYRRVVYPISDGEADALDAEFARHLKSPYGLNFGEWWYNAFRPELLLEKAVGSGEHTTSWNFYVFGEVIGLVVVYQKIGGPKEYRKSYFTPDFEPLPEETPDPAQITMPSPAARERMACAALAIGRELGFVRVDFLLDDDERPYLGEVTFCPGSGVNRFSPELDARLGALWPSVSPKTEG